MLLVVEQDQWPEAGEMRGTMWVRALGEEKGGAFTLILLPVHGGRFVLENARLPAGITVRQGGWQGAASLRRGTDHGYARGEPHAEARDRRALPSAPAFA